MTILYLTVFAACGVSAAFASPPLPASSALIRPPQTSPDPDALYAEREDPDKARLAAEIWQARAAADPTDFESAWKIARAMYWIGSHGAKEARRANLETGMKAARQAIALDQKQPEGHFWLAATMGKMAEESGRLTGLRYRGRIKEELETVLRLDPAFQQGSADRALGRWYYRVPGLFGGSKEKSEQHLRQSLKYNPNSTATLFFLAETLIALDRKDEARATLDKLLAAPDDPEWRPEDREFKVAASRLLGELR
ncbi:MAG: TRAP transporter TatT component family protein [Vicinamibacteraceae bacterium]